MKFFKNWLLNLFFLSIFPAVICGMAPTTMGGAVAVSKIPAITEECFFNERDCFSTIKTLLEQAEKEIICVQYDLKDEVLVKILKAKKENGVVVEVVANKSPDSIDQSNVDLLEQAGIPCWYWSQAGNMHNKIIIIDRRILVTGSYNWTSKAKESQKNHIVVTRQHAGGTPHPIFQRYMRHIIRLKEACSERNARAATLSTDIEIPITSSFAEEIFPRAYFSEGPNSGKAIQDVLCGLIKQARKSIAYASFDFDNDIIATAITDTCTHASKIRSYVLMCNSRINDRKNDGRSLSAFKRLFLERTSGNQLVNPIIFDGRTKDNRNTSRPTPPNHPGWMHNKFLIIDDKVVVAGSANGTNQSSDNWENICLINNPAIIAKFKEEFEKLVKYSRNASKNDFPEERRGVAVPKRNHASPGRATRAITTASSVASLGKRLTRDEGAAGRAAAVVARPTSTLSSSHQPGATPRVPVPSSRAAAQDRRVIAIPSSISSLGKRQAIDEDRAGRAAAVVARPTKMSRQ